MRTTNIDSTELMMILHDNAILALDEIQSLKVRIETGLDFCIGAIPDSSPGLRDIVGYAIEEATADWRTRNDKIVVAKQEKARKLWRAKKQFPMKSMT